MALAQNRVPNRVGVKTLRADYAQVYELNTQKADEIVRLREQVRQLGEALNTIARPGKKMRDTVGILDRYEQGFYVAQQAEMKIARAALRASGVDLGGKGG